MQLWISLYDADLVPTFYQFLRIGWLPKIELVAYVVIHIRWHCEFIDMMLVAFAILGTHFLSYNPALFIRKL